MVPIAWANTIDKFYGGVLLQKILEMPLKTAISYDDAIRIFSDKQKEASDAGDYGSKPGQCGWYYANFVWYISNLGYHIELTGDEFESVGAAEIRT